MSIQKLVHRLREPQKTIVLAQESACLLGVVRRRRPPSTELALRRVPDCQADHHKQGADHPWRSQAGLFRWFGRRRRIRLRWIMQRRTGPLPQDPAGPESHGQGDRELEQESSPILLRFPKSFSVHWPASAASREGGVPASSGEDPPIRPFLAPDSPPAVAPAESPRA